MKRLNLILWTFLMVSATVLTGCSSDDIATVISEPKTPVSTDQWHVKILADKGSQAFTRALAEGSDVDGEAGIIATWSNGDEISVWSGDTKIGTLTATPQGDGHQAVLEGTISGNFKTGDKLMLTYIMPDSKYRTYNGQDGTLSRLAQYFDYAAATVTVTQVTSAVDESEEGTVTTGNATFESQQAIIRLTCKQNGTPLNVQWLCIFSESGMIGGADGGKLEVVPQTPSSDIYIAMTNLLSTADIYYFCIKTDNGWYYTKTATGNDGLPTASAKIEDGNFYPIEINNWTSYTPEDPPTTPDPPTGDPRVNPDNGGGGGTVNPNPDPEPEPIPIPIPVDHFPCWPLVTDDGQLVLSGSEGHVVGLLVAHDISEGLVMCIQEGGATWGTQTEWCEGHIGGGNGLDMGNAYGTSKQERWTEHAKGSFLDFGGWDWGSQPPYQAKYYTGDWTRVQTDGKTNTDNLLECTGPYYAWNYWTCAAHHHAGEPYGGYYISDSYVDSHNHPAAILASNGCGLSAPSTSNGWFLPSAMDWYKAAKGIGYARKRIYGTDYIIADNNYRLRKNFITNVNYSLRRAAPWEFHQIEQGHYYWTSTERSPSEAMVCTPSTWSNSAQTYIDSNTGFFSRTKTNPENVRPFCKIKHIFSYSGTNLMRLYDKFANELEDI